MRAGKYTFRCGFTTQALLPPYKGSTLRGGFGHALKKISCALRHQECGSCLLFETCAYAFLFEVKKALSFESRRLRIANRPHPYVMVPPAEDKRQYEKGDTFTFDLILFGRANDYLPHILYAVTEMGKNGLGKMAGGQAGRLEVGSVSLNGEVIYTGGSLANIPSLPRLSLESAVDSHGQQITLSCLTPLRLKYRNELRDSLPFHILVRAALRRISSLEAVYGDGEPDLDYKGISARAAEVKIKSSNCRWHDIQRYSNRQHSVMKFGGLLGTIIYEGENLAGFSPLLRYCEQAHLGKQTSFGLGRIALQDGAGE